jgi:hypothetical protein
LTYAELNKQEDENVARKQERRSLRSGRAIGSRTARACAREGAKLFLTGCMLALLETLAKEISAAGGAVETA